MVGLSKPWVPMIGDRVKVRSVPAAEDVEAARRCRGKLGTVVEYRPSGAREVEEYAVLVQGERVPVYFPAVELDPLTE